VSRVAAQEQTIGAALSPRAGIPAMNSRVAVLVPVACEQEAVTALAQAIQGGWLAEAAEHAAWMLRARYHQAQEAVGYGRHS